MSSPKNATEIGQRRYYTWRGKKYPSVTTILKALPKEWLGAWAAKLTAELAVNDLPTLIEHIDWHQAAADAECVICAKADPRAAEFDPADAAIRYLKGAPWRKRDEAADRGTAVHEAAEAGSDIDSIPENARARYAQYQNWVDLYKPRILAKEFQCWSLSDGYAGTADLLFEFGGDLWLGDIKTGSVVDHSMRLQMAAYRYADFVGTDDRMSARVTQLLDDVTRCAVIHLTDTTQMFIEVDAGFDTFEAFRNVQRVSQWLEAPEQKTQNAGGELVLPQIREVVA